MTGFRRGDFIRGHGGEYFVLHYNEDDDLLTVAYSDPTTMEPDDPEPSEYRVDRLDTRPEFGLTRITAFDDRPDWAPYAQDYFGVTWSGYPSSEGEYPDYTGTDTRTPNDAIEWVDRAWQVYSKATTPLAAAEALGELSNRIADLRSCSNTQRSANQTGQS